MSRGKGAVGALAVFVVMVMALMLMVTVLFSATDDCEGYESAGGGGGGGGAGVPAGSFSLPEHNALDHVTSGWRTPDRPDHRGMDIAQGPGTPLYAFADGVVADAGPASGFGNWIVIDHEIEGRKISTVYGHMYDDGVGVKTGETVKAGQQIGIEGSNGQSTGNHLHFEVWEGGRLTGGHDVNPQPWLERAVEPGTGGSAPAGSAPAGGTNGGGVLLVGDSLTVGARAQLEQAMPGVSIDAKGGRQYREGLKNLQNNPDTFDTVVMALGTNGPFTQADVDATIAAAKGARVYLTTVAGPKVPSAPAVNELVRANSGKVEIIDIAAKIDADPGIVGADGIHHTPHGKQVFAETIAAAVGGGAAAPQPSRTRVDHGAGSNPGTPTDAGPTQTTGGALPPSPKFSEVKLQRDTIYVGRAVIARFPQIQLIGGWRPGDSIAGDHPNGLADDIMIPDWDTDAGRQLGDDILAYLWGNREHFKIKYFIWRDVYYPSDGEAAPYTQDRGDPTTMHMDHIHVTTYGGGYPTGGETYGPAPAGGSAVPGSPGGGGVTDKCAHLGGVDAGLDTRDIPPEFVKWITLAGRVCKDITAPLMAGLIDQESQFTTGATSTAGAQGPAQFMPETWAGMGTTVDDNGEPTGPPGSGDIRAIPDAVMASGRLMCQNLDQVRQWKAQGRVAGDDIELALAAYNAGGGRVLQAGGVPAIAETQKYVKVIPEKARHYAAQVK